MRRIVHALRLRTIPPLVQFSMVRTGSTLVWNAMRHAAPSVRDIPKRHDLNPVLRSRLSPTLIVTTVRNPLDALCSILEARQLDPTREQIAACIRELRENGLADQLAILRRPRTLFLRYESFHRDFDHLFDELDRFLGTSTSADVRDRFGETFRIERVSERSRRLGDFESFSHEDFIHGRHISSHRGRPGYHKQILTPDAIDIVRSDLAPYFEAFGY